MFFKKVNKLIERTQLKTRRGAFNVSRLASLGIIGMGLSIVIFQNCDRYAAKPSGEGSGQLSSTSSTQVSPQSNDVSNAGEVLSQGTAVASDNNNAAQQGTLQVACNKMDGRFVSVFSWKNVSDDEALDHLTMPEAGVVQDLKAIGRGVIFNGSASMLAAKKDWESLPNSSPVEWYLSFAVNPSTLGTGTQTTIHIDKKTEDDGRILVCLFGSDTDVNGVKTLKPTLKFTNVGSGELVNFVGHLSNPDKFIACRISKPTSDPRFKVRLHFAAAMVSESIWLDVGAPFVLRRGCY